MEGTLAERGPDEVVVDAGGRRIALTASVAETVSVIADPSPPPRVALPEQLVIAADRYGRYGAPPRGELGASGRPRRGA